MNRIEVRTAGPQDIPSLLRLIEEYWAFENIDGFSQKLLAPQLERLIQNPALGTAWIATVNDRIVGYLVVVYVFSIEFVGMVAEFDEFFVEAANRGSGVGKRLIQAAELECQRLGCTNISLELSRDNDSARRFYYRNGFQDRGRYTTLTKMLFNPS